MNFRSNFLRFGRAAMRDDVVQLGEQRLAVAEDEVVEEDRRVGMRQPRFMTPIPSV